MITMQNQTGASKGEKQCGRKGRRKTKKDEGVSIPDHDIDIDAPLFLFLFPRIRLSGAQG